MPSLMRLADGAAALAKRGKPAVPATAPSAAAVPMKFLRVRAVDELFTGGKYYDALGQCRGRLAKRQA
jgi:hypothetical protein